MREKKKKIRGGDRKAGGAREAEGGFGTRTRLRWCTLSFVVSSPDPLTLYILLKGWRERRDGSYRHWLHARASECVGSYVQSAGNGTNRNIGEDATERSLSLRCDFSHSPLPSLFLCVYIHSLQNLVGEKQQWSLQHSHSPAESTRLSHAFLCPFISFSLSSWTEKKNDSLYGGGV